MPMINYPSPQAFDPYSKLQSGIATGLQLGRARNKEQPLPSDATIPDPGERPQVDAGTLLQNEYEDLLRYEEMNKKIKKAKNITPEERKQLLDTAVQTGQIKTPIVQSIVLNDDMIEPEEVINVMKSVKDNKSNSAFDVQLLIKRLGGEDSVGGGAIKAKLVEIQQVQKKLNEERKIILKDVLKSIDQYTDNPKAYQGKSGISNIQTLNVINRKYEYVKELSQLDPEWAKEYLEERKEGKGFAPKFEYRLDAKGRLGVFKNGVLMRGARSSNPNFEMTGSKPISPTEFTQLMLYGKISERTPEGEETPRPLNPKVSKSKKDKYTVGKIYKDANGNRAKYLGNGKWQKL